MLLFHIIYIMTDTKRLKMYINLPDLRWLYYAGPDLPLQYSLIFISWIVVIYMAVMLRKSFKQLSLRRTKVGYEPLTGKHEPLTGEHEPLIGEYDKDIKIEVQSEIKMESSVENSMFHTEQEIFTIMNNKY